MAFSKVVEARVWGVTVQVTDMRLTAGDSSGGTFTRRANPLRGTLLWDRCMFVLHNVSVTGAELGGSYTVTIHSDAAVLGITGLPIARVSAIGPNSNSTIVMDNLHQSSASPLPTHLDINQTAGGSTQGITLTCDVIAKQYRGTLSTPAAATSERILRGVMHTPETTTEDSTYTLGTSGSDLGMSKMRLWDSALYWVVAGLTVTGTHDVDMVTSVGGDTFSIASTGVGGAVTAASDKIALANNFFGQSPNPTQIIWTETTAGGAVDSRIVMMAKSGRGSQAKS